MAIELISKIKPKNNGSFPMVDAKDVDVVNNKRLTEVLPENVNNRNIASAKLLTQEQYDELISNGEITVTYVDPSTSETVTRIITYDQNTIYLIYEDDVNQSSGSGGSP